ncbi:transcription initiation factor TFIID subunit 8 [Beta vulgaris subsp. vulgaris]|uniref:transcription initiation factor TFIID subunit 8 n=1 Tax=Beta vulgaris subsp. vulgaris TaxID=3555 RepID=UPI00203686D5|nr:transcription initiation factor TFIID subunit 8 [Beta vulgaris subsp. vulgaris]
MKRENEEDSRGRERERAEADDFGRAASKMAVAQICEGIGYEAVKQSCLEALSDIVIRYICDLGKSATFYANLAGRSESNVFDIFKGLQDLGPEISNQQLSHFVEENEIPFAQPIPRFPIPSSSKHIQTPTFLQMAEIPVSNHIPDWLPAFPDPHTYIRTPVWNHRKLELQIDKGEQARQRRKAERSLLNLQQRLLSNALAGPSCSGSNGENRMCMEDNSVSGPPVGNKDGYQNGVCDRKHVLVKQTFAPVIDAFKAAGGSDDVSDSDAMDLDKRVIPNKRRPVIHFKLKAGKKMLVEDLDIHLRNKMNEKRGSLMGRDDAMDDKKRRAEFILRQSSMDNPQEVSQM